jgi:hypothetical protein
MTRDAYLALNEAVIKAHKPTLSDYAQLAVLLIFAYVMHASGEKTVGGTFLGLGVMLAINLAVGWLNVLRIRKIADSAATSDFAPTNISNVTMLGNRVVGITRDGDRISCEMGSGINIVVRTINGERTETVDVGAPDGTVRRFVNGTYIPEEEHEEATTSTDAANP